MPWGPEDWDALAMREAADEPHASRDQAAVQDLLQRLPGHRHMTAADLGCGRGAWLPFLVRNFRNVVAVDYAPASLSVARRSCAGAGVVFRRRDLRDLTPFRSTFHVALALESIVGPRTSDVDRVLGQVYQSLVDGGLLVATVPASPRRGGPVRMRLCGRDEVAEGGPLHFAEVDLQYRLRAAGFGGVRLRRFENEGDRAPVLLALAWKRGNN